MILEQPSSWLTGCQVVEYVLLAESTELACFLALELAMLWVRQSLSAECLSGDRWVNSCSGHALGICHEDGRGWRVGERRS